MWTACATWSQGITVNRDSTDVRPVSFPFWMVREIALDLSEKDHLEGLQELSLKEIALLRTLAAGLERNSRHKSLQISLLKAQITSLEVSLKTGRRRRPRDQLWHRLLQMAGALGIGYVLGSLSTSR